MTWPQSIGNHLVATVLRSPIHSLLSSRLMLLTYEGRRTGRSYTIPVNYAEHDGGLVVYAGQAARKQWWRNLQTARQVEIVLRGRRLSATATVSRDPALRDAYLDRYPKAAAALRREAQPVAVVFAGLRTPGSAPPDPVTPPVSPLPPGADR